MPYQFNNKYGSETKIRHVHSFCSNHNQSLCLLEVKVAKQLLEMKQHEVLCVLYFSSCTQLHAISLVAAQNSFETFECHYEFQKEHEIFSFK